MNRTLLAAALVAALGITGMAHAQMNATSPTFEPAAAEPATQQSPDFVLSGSQPATASGATMNYYRSDCTGMSAGNGAAPCPAREGPGE